ncbi:hypothetical protein KAJ87_02595 [Candidatus Pacearchaeota archaeon]|nr:hypothetical protein [Candidatus Pacearchaeota archaeon]
MKKRNLKKDLFKRGKKNKLNCSHCGACGGGIYFFGLIGAAIYYLQTATSFWGGVLGILKALVWPAILIYKLLGFLS